MSFDPVLLVAIALIVSALAVIAARLKIKRDATRIASENLRTMTAIWATLGPFVNGTQSAAAMWVAWAITKDVEYAKSMQDALKRHRDDYDQNREYWESLQAEVQQEGLEFPYTDELVDSFYVEANRNGWLDWVWEQEYEEKG